MTYESTFVWMHCRQEIFSSWIINGLLTQRRAFSETQKLRKPSTRGFHPTYFTVTRACEHQNKHLCSKVAVWASSPPPPPPRLLHTECAWKGGCTYKLHNVATHSVRSDMTNVEKFVSKIAPLEMQEGCVIVCHGMTEHQWDQMVKMPRSQ